MKSKLVIALLMFALASTVLFASSSTVLQDGALLFPMAKHGKLSRSTSLSSSLSDPSHINGTVTDAVTMSPIKDANVTANGVSDLTDDNGHYELEIASGNYTVTAKKSGYESQSKNATVAVNQTTTVDFALSPTMGWIAGAVTNANTSMPIEGANVTANGFSTETNATGHYRIQVAAPKTYNVTASKIGYLSETVANVSVQAGRTTLLNITLMPLAQIKAVVVVNPRALNVRSNGRWITVSIELPEGFNAKDINISSIRLNGTVGVDLAAPMEIANSELIVKFSRAAVEALVMKELGESSRFSTVALTVTGKLTSGTTFTASDTIKTIFNMPHIRS